jgi:preprotein translocase subunit SecG
MSYLLGILLVLSSFFLILLVLIQQGRGGGLAGAFGGMGGQSAFGTKAGDLFTKITIGVAAVWILLCVAAVKWSTQESSPFGPGLGTNAGQTVSPAETEGTTSEKTLPTSPPAAAEGSGSKTPAEKGGDEE